VRVALIPTAADPAGQWVAFPTVEQLSDAVFDMVVAGRVVGSGADADVAIMMVEAEATENVIEKITGGAQAPTEDVVARGLEAAKPFIAELCAAQQALATAAPGTPREFPLFPPYQDDAYAAVAEIGEARLGEIMQIADKQERDDATDELKATVLEQLDERFTDRLGEVGAAFKALTKAIVRKRILTDHFR